MAKSTTSAAPAAAPLATQGDGVPAAPPAAAPKGPTLASLARNEGMAVTPSEMRRIATDPAFTRVLAMAAPAQLQRAVNRLAASLSLEMQRNPTLQGCSGLSLLGCLLQSTALGLEPGGVLGQAYFVPYRNQKLGATEAQFQIGYKGLISLAHRNPDTQNFDAHPVFEDDTFDIEYGTNPRVIHKPNRDAVPDPEKRKLVGFYAVFVKHNGGCAVRYMSLAEVCKHRDQYSKQKNSGPWVTAFLEMGRKTPLRMLGKVTPISVDMTTAATLDEYAEADVEQGLRHHVRQALDGGEVDFTIPSQTADRVADALGAGESDAQN